MAKILVRDFFPQSRGGEVGSGHFRRATTEEYYQLLVTQLIAQAVELERAQDPSERYEKFGDVLELLRAISCTPKFGGIRFDELDRLRENKAHRYGGYNQQWVHIIPD